jgi:peptide deformylase
MKLPICYYGNPILRQKAQPLEGIDDDIRQLVMDMQDTVNILNGVGLAAPQIGRSIALFITLIPRYLDDDTMLPGELRVYINPKILEYSEEIWPCQEGCLSIPKFWDIVERPFKVKVEATDLNGTRFTEELEGYDAHVIMHENDHLNGVLFIDRLPPKRRKELDAFLKGVKKKYANK